MSLSYKYFTCEILVLSEPVSCDFIEELPYKELLFLVSQKVQFLQNQRVCVSFTHLSHPNNRQSFDYSLDTGKSMLIRWSTAITTCRLHIAILGQSTRTPTTATGESVTRRQGICCCDVILKCRSASSPWKRRRRRRRRKELRRLRCRRTKFSDAGRYLAADSCLFFFARFGFYCSLWLVYYAVFYHAVFDSPRCICLFWLAAVLVNI